MEISVTELSIHTDKYVDMVKDQDILILKNGSPHVNGNLDEIVSLVS